MEAEAAKLKAQAPAAYIMKTGNVDAAMLSVPYDLFMEKDGFRPLAYMKDVAEFPLLGLIAHAR